MNLGGVPPTSLRVQAKALTKADKALQDQGYFSHPDWLLLSSRPHDLVTLLFPESALGLACAVPPVWVTSFRMSLGQLLPASLCKRLSIVAFLAIRRKMTTYPQHPLSPLTSSMPSNTVLLLLWFSVLSARTQAPWGQRLYFVHCWIPRIETSIEHMQVLI